MANATDTDKKKKDKKKKPMLRDKFFKCPECNENIRVELGISVCPKCGAELHMEDQV